MKISTIQFGTVKNISIDNKLSLLPKLNSDSVSFSSLQEKRNQTIQMAEDFGYKLFELYQKEQLSTEKIGEIGCVNVPILLVDNMKNLSKIMGADTQNFYAYTLPKYSEACELDTITIYAPDKEMSPRIIGSLAHEYCHCIQRYKDNSYMGLADVTNKNLTQARMLNNISAIIFGELEKRKFIQCANKFMLYKTMGMDETDALCKAYGCENEKEFRQSIKKLFNETYDVICPQFIKHPETSKYIPFKEEPLKLKRIIRKQCSTRADMEAEAYTVQRNVLDKINQTGSPSEISMSPLFYTFISDALK